jgi:hypothetical protein
VNTGKKEGLAMSKKNISIGIIAEDISDVDSAKILIRRILQNDRIGVKQFVGKGCGKIKRKCNAWAIQLKNRGCNVLIVLHDLDSSNLYDLNDKIFTALDPCPIKIHYICIAVQELEAWLLSDPEAIRVGVKLRYTPKVKQNPELISSPKEYLGEVIHRTSNKEKIYLNTKHNEMIARELSIELANARCPSFSRLHTFLSENLMN